MGLGAGGPEFETFSAFRARRARETSVRGGLVPNVRGTNGIFFTGQTGHVHGMLAVQKWGCPPESLYVLLGFIRTMSEYCSARVSRVGLSTK